MSRSYGVNTFLKVVVSILCIVVLAGIGVGTYFLVDHYNSKNAHTHQYSDEHVCTVCGEDEPISGLTLDYSKAKREYVAGSSGYGTFDSSKLVVYKDYADGDSEVITSYSLVVPDLSTVGVKDVVVSYGGFSSKYQVYAIPDVEWETNRLSFASIDDGSLEFFVTDRKTNELNGAFSADGYFLYKATDTHYEIYSMKYIDYQGSQVFTCDGVKSYVSSSDNALVSIVMSDGNTFMAGYNTWHGILHNTVNS